MQHKPLDQQVMVVFGASSGIGRATALLAAERGAVIVAAGRNRAALDSLAAAVPGSITAGMADAAEPDQVAAIAELAATAHGRIDTWAHVAGVGAYGRFEDMTVEELRVVDVDLLGPLWGARAALPHLRRQGGAYVVVSSELAKRSFPLASSYCAAKHGVDGFVEALRAELQHEGAPVSVTQIMPAAVATPFFEHARSRLGVRASGPPPVYSPEVAASVLHAAEHAVETSAWGWRPRCSWRCSASLRGSWTPPPAPRRSGSKGRRSRGHRRRGAVRGAEGGRPGAWDGVQHHTLNADATGSSVGFPPSRPEVDPD